MRPSRAPTPNDHTPMSTVRVLVVDDTADVRLLLRMALDRDPRFTVVGEAADGVQAIAAAGELQPDLVVLDRHMPLLDGMEATPAIRRLCPEAVILIFTSNADEDLRRLAVAAGADRVWSKLDVPLPELADEMAGILLDRSAATPAATTDTATATDANAHPTASPAAANANANATPAATTPPATTDTAATTTNADPTATAAAATRATPAAKDEINLRLGPLPSIAARAWIANTSTIVAAVQARRHELDLADEAPRDITELFLRYLAEWRDVAETGEEFYWAAVTDVGTARRLVECWAAIDAMGDEQLAMLGCTWSPPEGEPFFQALTLAVLEALAAHQATQELAASLQEQWGPHP